MRLDVVPAGRPLRASVGLLLIAVTVGLLTVLSGAVAQLDREGRVPAGPLGLPDRLDAPGYFAPTAGRSPRGPVALLANGSRGPYLRPGDTLAAGLVGPGGYRMSERVGFDEFHTGEDMLLSPQGDRVVFPTSLAMSVGAAQVQDLRTGRQRDLRMPASDADGRALAPEGWSVLAWLPDGASFVVGRQPGPDATGTPAVVTIGELGVLRPSGSRSGTYRRIADIHGSLVDGFAVAVSQDGGRLAFALGPDLLVYGIADATRRMGAELPTGSLLAGKGAWTPDGSAVAVAVPWPAAADQPAEWRIQLLDAATGAVRPSPALPPVRDAVAVRAQGWSPEGALIAVAYRPERQARPPLAPPMSDADPTRFEVVRRADLVSLRPGDDRPRTLLRPPSQTLSLDVATAAIASGRRFANPKPPPITLSPVTAFGVMVIVGLMLLLVVTRVLGFTVRLPRGPVPVGPTLAEPAVQGW